MASLGVFALISAIFVQAAVIPWPWAGNGFQTPGRECSSLIADSLRPSFSWAPDSAAALELARCLQTAVPAKDSCVFYTQGSAQDARKYARKRNLTTVYDVYHDRAHFFRSENYPASAWEAQGHLRDFWRITSRAYTMACAGTATLVIPPDQEPCSTSIWLTDEHDAIKTGLSKITSIWRVSWDQVIGQWVSKLWDMGVRAVSGDRVELRKREIVLKPVKKDTVEVMGRAEERTEEWDEEWGWRNDVEDDPGQFR